MSANILLVEPKTKTSYPPLGLMKIATYHQLLGDTVVFTSGSDKELRAQVWDKIYITSVFTYNMNTLIKTIRFYQKNPQNQFNIRVGGIAATLMPGLIKKETGIEPHTGLLDGIDPFLEDLSHTVPDLKYLQECKASIDNLPPSYNIFKDNKLGYSKILENAYFFYTTKGCPNSCKFCAVKTLEPTYVDYIPILPRIKYITDRWGERKNLLLLDNNIAASNSYDRIIDEIKDCGFAKNQKLKKNHSNGRVSYLKRTVDFNQGVDARLMTEKRMKKMSEIAIEPFRLAFDDISLAPTYYKKMKLALECGISSLSNYMLFNFNDKPIDLYKRFIVNMKIKEEYPHAKIFSFPMRYSPIDQTDRKFLGKHWSKREVRAIQLILNATHGIVSHNRGYFYRAFGATQEKYLKILSYPYQYIINRNYFEVTNDHIQQWEKTYDSLSHAEREELRAIIQNGPITTFPKIYSKRLITILEHYKDEHARVLTRP